MKFPRRTGAGAGAASALVVLALSGCSSHWGCADTTAERGEAGVRVRVEEVTGRPLDVFAEVVDWRLEPHPQVPAEGDQVHFRFRFDGADDMSDPAVDACAVDEERVALGCRTIHSYQAFGPNGSPIGDEWLAVADPERVTGVLFVPNDQSYVGPTCEEDAKDGGGPRPPEPARAGDRL
ncbi:MULTISPECIES: hypothetical protein [Streptomyces]|uniref:hypothetical protein n=1 Tax=Streptomyces TaxID=1883 RepID=UPI0021B040DB|nr:hypothetical protein [Streptomyces sp. WAC06273]MDV6287758.1 hypothetical protein [Streptomyces sp. UP1A-1]